MNSVIPKTIELSPSISKNSRKLIWLQNQSNTVNWSKWDAVVSSIDAYKYWSQYNTKIFAAVISKVTGDSETFLADLYELSKKVSCLAVSQNVIMLRPAQYWHENYNNILNVSAIHEQFPLLNTEWDGTIEDAICIVGLFYRYTCLVDCEMSETRKKYTNGNMKLLKGTIPGEVWTFTQFFRHKNYDRYRELKECLKKNCECPHIDKIVLLNEKDYSDEWKKMKGSEKIQQVIIGRRLVYSDFLKYVHDEVPQNVFSILCNADIFFGDSLLDLFKIDMEDNMLSLLRWNVEANGDIKLFGPRSDSQDTWIFLSDSIKKRTWDYNTFNFQLGQPGCDNAFNGHILRQKFIISNPCLTFKTFHLHNVDTRSYNTLDFIPSKLYINLAPSNILDTRQEIAPKEPPTFVSHELASFEVKSSSLSNAITYCTMLEKERDRRYKWEPGVENHYFQPKIPVYKWTNSGVTPNGLVYDLFSIYVGKHLKTDNDKYVYWKNANVSILTPLQKRKRMFAIPFDDTMLFKHPDTYILYYLSRVMRLLKEYPDTSFWIPQNYTEYITYFEWPSTKLEAAFFTDNTACWADEIIGYLPGPECLEIGTEDVTALRSNMSSWISEPKPKLCTILTSKVVTREFIENRILPFLKSNDDGWQIQIARHDDFASYESIFGSSLCIFVGGGKADKSWSKLWALPKGCRVIEFQQELDINGEFQHLAHVADLKSWILLLCKGSVSDVQEQIMEQLEKWFNKNGDELIGSD
jgi:hypothetical protein